MAVPGRLPKERGFFGGLMINGVWGLRLQAGIGAAAPKKQIGGLPSAGPATSLDLARPSV